MGMAGGKEMAKTVTTTIVTALAMTTAAMHVLEIPLGKLLILNPGPAWPRPLETSQRRTMSCPEARLRRRIRKQRQRYVAMAAASWLC